MTNYQKRYTSESGDFEIWQIRTDGSSRQIWNWETRTDYDPNAVIEIPYIAPPPPDPPSLETLKAQKIAEIKFAFEEALTQGCPIQLPDGREFRIDCEPKNQADFTALLIGLQAFGIQQTNIRGYDNITRTLSAEEVMLMRGQMFQYVQMLMNKKWMLSDLADKAGSAEALAEVNW